MGTRPQYDQLWQRELTNVVYGGWSAGQFHGGRSLGGPSNIQPPFDLIHDRVRAPVRRGETDQCVAR